MTDHHAETSDGEWGAMCIIEGGIDQWSGSKAHFWG